MNTTFIKRGLIGALLASTMGVMAAYAQSTSSYLVFFDFDKSDLTPAAMKILDKAAADALAGKPAKIEVSGYTDASGTEKYNMALSRRRAMAVEAVLTAKGISSKAIGIQAKGEKEQLVPTADGVKEPQNRRVSIVFTVPAAAPPKPAPAPEKTAEAPAPEAEAPGFDVWAQVETGITANGSKARSKVNFGHLFTDRTNEVLLNQVLLTAEKPLDPKATGYDVGFRLQGMYGSDARYTHFLGELDNTVKGINQLDIVEAWVGLHTPWFTEGGIDFKIGQFPTYLGSEVIDPSINYFYSKSYIFNFGIPLKHTGVMANAHVNETLDLLAGVNSGVNTSLGSSGDNNSATSFQFGFGLNGLADGKLTILALSHIGPENAGDDKNNVYLNDIVFTYKPSETLTFVTELNYIKNDAFNATGYGIAQYGSYAFDEQWSANARAEVWEDHNGFFVAGFPGKYDFVALQKGLPNSAFNFTSPKATSYGALTLGLTYKPATAPAPLRNLLIRPEVRYDTALNSTKPFKDGKDSNQFTFGLDVVFKL
jgi:hypothetical protein